MRIVLLVVDMTSAFAFGSNRVASGKKLPKASFPHQLQASHGHPGNTVLCLAQEQLKASFLLWSIKKMDGKSQCFLATMRRL